MTQPSRNKLILGLVMVGTVVAVVSLLWHFASLSEIASPKRIAEWFETFQHSKWGPLIVIGVYVFGGLIMLPVTGLSAATAMVFDPLQAVITSFTGTMLSAALLYVLGASFLRGRTKQIFGERMKRIEEAFSKQGILAVATVRMIPLAPFTVVNLAAGAIGVRFRDYMLGTALGLAPGITVLSLFGNQVKALWRSPSASGVLLIVGIGLAWIAVSFGLQRWISARRASKPRAPDTTGPRNRRHRRERSARTAPWHRCNGRHPQKNDGHPGMNASSGLRPARPSSPLDCSLRWSARQPRRHKSNRRSRVMRRAIGAVKAHRRMRR